MGHVKKEDQVRAATITVGAKAAVANSGLTASQQVAINAYIDQLNNIIQNS